MFAELSIVIVNWNLKEDTLACLESLVAAGATPGQIILVDNGSQDGSVSAFQEKFGPALKIVENSENLGFAQASNQGLELALSQGAGWVLFLNNDTLVAPDFLEQMSRAAHEAKSYAILAPLIYYYSQPGRIWYLGDRRVPGTLITTNPYRGKEYNQSFANLIPVDFASGCAMMVKREVFEKTGSFDPTLVMYGEETDFIWRARLAGFRVAAVPQAHVWHKVSLSADRDQPRTRYLRIRNQIRFYRKYAHGLQRPTMFLFSLLRSWRLGLGDLLAGQTRLISPLVRGWLDGWRGQ